MYLGAIPNVAKLQTLDVLFALLPGLLTYHVQHALTKREEELKAAEAVLYRLVYTLAIHGIWTLLTLVGIYAVVHLSDARRIMGEIGGWSPDQKDGHVTLRNPKWLSDGKNYRRQIDHDDGYHSRVSDTLRDMA